VEYIAPQPMKRSRAFAKYVIAAIELIIRDGHGAALGMKAVA
jgi:hypothetical protein